MLLVVAGCALGLGAALALNAAAPHLGLPSLGALGSLPVACSPSMALAAAALGGTALAVAIGSVVVSARSRRKRERLEERLRRLGRTLVQTGELVTIVNRSGRIEFVSPAVERVTGYSRAELLGHRHRPRLPWYESEQVFDIVWSAVADGGAFAGTIAGRRMTALPSPCRSRRRRSWTIAGASRGSSRPRRTSRRRSGSRTGSSTWGRTIP